MVGRRALRRPTRHRLYRQGIASGMPLGICMTRADIMDWVPRFASSTFGGNPVAIAAAIATMTSWNAKASPMQPPWESLPFPPPHLAITAPDRR